MSTTTARTSGRQTILSSIVEAKTNIVVGFSINYVLNILILRGFGYDVTYGDAFWIGVVFTAFSILRIFVLRRWFNSMKWGHK
jgi:hypothetical protein